MKKALLATALCSAALSLPGSASSLEDFDPSVLLKQAAEGAQGVPAAAGFGLAPRNPLRHRFTAPDSGKNKTPYACTFHWFRAPDGRLIGLDLIRSDDTGKMALRAYLQGKDSSFHGWIYEAASPEWASFATQERPDLKAGRNVLGRGENWVAGAVRDEAQGMDVSFDLDMRAEGPGLGTGEFGLKLVELNAADYLKMRVKGWVSFNGEKIWIDSPGTASLHYGDRLPQASYIATFPGAFSENRLLMASALGDNLRFGDKVLGKTAFVYGYGSGKLPPFMFHVGGYERSIDLGGGIRLSLMNAQSFHHTLLGLPTVTGVARAVLEKPAPGLHPKDWLRKEFVDLGPVLFDYRGEDYIKSLPR
jgi:hypothetical protein